MDNPLIKWIVLQHVCFGGATDAQVLFGLFNMSIPKFKHRVKRTLRHFVDLTAKGKPIDLYHESQAYQEKDILEIKI